MSDKKIYWIVADVDVRNAGYRIRTLPIAHALVVQGCRIEILSIKDFYENILKIAVDAAVVIVAKPGDSDSYLCMKYLKTKGVPVIVDLFDNYFSWSSALVKRGTPWHWIRTLELSSGICASTPIIDATLRSLGFENIQNVSDAAPDNYRSVVPAVNVHAKWDAPKVLELLWFGISENPYFNAGIEDLISWIQVVCGLRTMLQRRYIIRLTLCTNRVSAVQDAVIYYTREGFDVRTEEWTEEGCEKLLSESHVVLIPTNLSAFSKSKTHNRCSDAIWRQCLVLASANGPYKDIPGAVHTSLDTLTHTLLEMDHETIAIRLNDSATFISTHYQVTDQAHSLAQLIQKTRKALQHRSATAALPSVLLAGEAMSISTLKLSRKLNYLSAGIAGSAVNGNFDFLLSEADADNNTLTFKISGKVTALFITGSNVFALDDLGGHAWTVRQEGDVNYLTISMPENHELIQRYLHLSAIRHAHGELGKQWFELAVELGICALHRMGFSAIEFGAADGGGWESWLTLCGQHLEKYTSQLRLQWAPSAGIVEAAQSSGVTTVL